MVMKRWCVVWAAASAALLNGCADPGAKAPPQAVATRPAKGRVLSAWITFPKGKDEVTVPTRGALNQLFVQVAINGDDAGWFIVDTGTGYTVVDQTTAKRLGLQSRGTQSVWTPGGHTNITAVGASSLTVGGIVFRDPSVFVCDMTVLRELTGGRLVGLLGGDILSRCPFMMDIQAGELTFYRREKFRPPVRATRSRLHVSLSRPTCSATIAGTHKVQILLDTGSDLELAVNPLVVRQHPELAARRGRTCSVSASAGGIVEQVAAPLGPFVFLDRSLPDVRFHFGDDWSWNLGKVVGYVGTRVLKRWRLTFDYAGGRIWSQPSINRQDSEPVDVNTRDFLGDTPLTRECSIERARRLIDAGADVNAVGMAGRTPLCVAVSHGNLEVVRLLLRKGAGVNAKSLRGQTPLIRAASGGPTEMLSAILDAGANVKDSDREGRTALMPAALRGEKDMVRLLLDRGAAGDAADSRGRTALMRAAWIGDRPTVELLLARGARADHADKKGRTVLMAAARGFNAQIIDVLLKSGASVASSDEEGLTALMHAAITAHVAAINKLLDRGAKLKSVNRRGQGALTLAAWYGRVEAMRTLVKRGASVNGTNNANDRPLVMAAESGQLPAVRFLLNNGADINSPAHPGRESALLVATIYAHEEIALELIRRGADVNQKDRIGDCPLLAAAWKCGPAVVKALIAKSAVINAKNDDGETPLFLTSYDGRQANAEALLAAGADVNAPGTAGLTALHIASGRGHIGMVRFLLKAGADPFLKTTNGNTAMDLAAHAGRRDIVEVLKQAGGKSK